MAASYLAKNALSNMSKSFPRNPSLSLQVSSIGKVSRVCFASAASKYPEQDRNAAEEMGESGAYMSKDSLREASDKASNMSERAKETVKEGTERAKEKATEVKDSTSEAVQKMEEKSKEGTERTMETAQSLGEKAEQKVQDAWEQRRRRGRRSKKSWWVRIKTTTAITLSLVMRSKTSGGVLMAMIRRMTRYTTDFVTK